MNKDSPPTTTSGSKPSASKPAPASSRGDSFEGGGSEQHPSDISKLPAKKSSLPAAIKLGLIDASTTSPQQQQCSGSTASSPLFPPTPKSAVGSSNVFTYQHGFSGESNSSTSSINTNPMTPSLTSAPDDTFSAPSVSKSISSFVFKEPTSGIATTTATTSAIGTSISTSPSTSSSSSSSTSSMLALGGASESLGNNSLVSSISNTTSGGGTRKYKPHDMAALHNNSLSLPLQSISESPSTLSLSQSTSSISTACNSSVASSSTVISVTASTNLAQFNFATPPLKNHKDDKETPSSTLTSSNSSTAMSPPPTILISGLTKEDEKNPAYYDSLRVLGNFPAAINTSISQLSQELIRLSKASLASRISAEAQQQQQQQPQPQKTPSIDNGLGAISSATTSPVKRTSASGGPPDMQPQTSISDDLSSTASSILYDSVTTDYIEEDKVIIPGITVRAAKLPRLVLILVESFDKDGELIPAGTDFPRVFFLMHKWFMESEVLANMLLDLYESYNEQTTSASTERSGSSTDETANQQEISSQHSSDYQLKICHAFRYWINTFPFHFVVDTPLIDVIRRFTNILLNAGHQDHLQFVDMSNIGSYDWMRRLTTRIPPKSKQQVPLGFSKIEPEVLASQLTFLEWKTLRRINFSDYKSYAIKGSIQDNPPLERSIQLFNGLSQWIQCMVLSKTLPKQRADIIHKFIEVAQHLRQLQNFNSLMAVIGGICHSALARLSKTNVYLSEQDQKVLADFMELLSSNYNYAQYRKGINEAKDFWIPIIGIHLKDMISLHTAHLDKLDNDLINFRKMAQLSIIFQNLTDLQNSVPPIQENRDLIKLLQLSLDMNYTEDEIYELSLAREPRNSVSSAREPSTQKFSAFADWAKSLSTPLDPQIIQRHVNAMVDSVFKNYDHDRDGFISHAEFEEIAQNFPFIDSFAVLDADQDGMISKIEMKSYFLKANYNALKSEFKHDFHEITYLKPTFCTHCDGFLWGLIKQGWKCKDCGINAHRHCRDRVVYECRPKKMLARQASHSGSVTASLQQQQQTPTSPPPLVSKRVRSVSSRAKYEHRKQRTVSQRQKSTQTDAYDDLFVSDEEDEDEDDESVSSTENETTSTSTLKTVNATQAEAGSNLNAENSSSHDDLTVDVAALSLSGGEQSQHKSPASTRTKRYTKPPKRRKSLPSQYSSVDEPHHPISSAAMTLIPRGPLICSEHLDGWLPERRPLPPPLPPPVAPPPPPSVPPPAAPTTTSSPSWTTSPPPAYTTVLIPREPTRPYSFSLQPKREQYPFITVRSTPATTVTAATTTAALTATANTPTVTAKSSITTQKPSSTIISSTILLASDEASAVVSAARRSPVLYDDAKAKVSVAETAAAAHRYRQESDIDLSDYMEDLTLGDGTASSNEEDNDVFLKLREAEKEREKLALENLKIKQQLESANKTIKCLTQEMSHIKKDTFNYMPLLDQVDTIQTTAAGSPNRDNSNNTGDRKNNTTNTKDNNNNNNSSNC